MAYKVSAEDSSEVVFGTGRKITLVQLEFLDCLGQCQDLGLNSR